MTVKSGDVIYFQLLTMTTHALQRLTSSPRSVSAIIHVTGLLFFAESFSWLPNITNPLHNGFGGSYQFLTFIALTISTITFGVSLFLAGVSLCKQLFTLKNILSICATPLEVLVSILYWSLRAVDESFCRATWARASLHSRLRLPRYAGCHVDTGL